MNKKLSIMGYSFHGLLGGSHRYFSLHGNGKNRYWVDAVDIWSGFVPESMINEECQKIKSSG